MGLYQECKFGRICMEGMHNSSISMDEWVKFVHINEHMCKMDAGRDNVHERIVKPIRSSETFKPQSAQVQKYFKPESHNLRLHFKPKY